ncbi:TIGR03643 family protein [uncultured Sulfitobacter sp.]|uniref:TIGR03643 family protein n=1 Tax=uncultured Sulfitobacter sp. TaxID=191468 RepID=UPI002630332A|nr:TIGR03643 family protein [uncultured Sulfitobacter sp.]
MSSKPASLKPEAISDIIQMALSDHVPFATIKAEYGLSEKEVQALMRRELKAGSYRAWRKRVHAFGTRREQYK